MKCVHVFATILLLATVSLAQQPSSTSNPQERTANPTDQNYTRPSDQTYTPPVETGRNWGGWGLLGLLGLGGLLGRRRETTSYRDERTYDQEQRRAG
jgi:MYXO-CTERM domain-containing protein